MDELKAMWATEKTIGIEPVSSEEEAKILKESSGDHTYCDGCEQFFVNDHVMTVTVPESDDAPLNFCFKCLHNTAVLHWGQDHER